MIQHCEEDVHGCGVHVNDAHSMKSLPTTNDFNGVKSCSIIRHVVTVTGESRAIWPTTFVQHEVGGP
ncbi:hypothetical protein TSMEX_011690 [Taenia solium]|eukprot:TsM_000268900 transcript=TsM_000268900 gene=TsM_000268900